MDNTVELKNKYLKVIIRLPGSEPGSERFDSACVVKQVILNGKHSFCQPEQKKPERVTTYGMGLSSEFAWNEITADVPAGEQFPKLGIGLFTQLPEGGRYDKWKHYEIDSFQKSWTVEKDRIIFVEEPKECCGVAAKIVRSVSLFQNTITISTTLENVGKKALDLSEYQHNFVAIDDIPVGPGYCLELPFDGGIEENNWEIRALDERGVPAQPVPYPLYVDGRVIRWKEDMDFKTFHKMSGRDKILTMPEYTWKLSHEDNSATVSETCRFVPEHLSIWGIEHCICTEVHCKIHVEPGDKQNYSRTWYFEDDVTRQTE